jgi:ribulose 1,5-bisphosphate carboxylase large subunit-like protein
VFLPGAFSSTYVNESETQAAVSACKRVTGGIRPVCPIIAGGKRPELLQDYINTVGSTDFMIIAATSIDEHPQGLEAGARAFRTAWDQLNR